MSHSFVAWRKALGEKIAAAAKKYPPRVDVDAASLADAFTVLIEGAYITSKALNEPQVVAQQLRHFRNYLELLFSPA